MFRDIRIAVARLLLAALFVIPAFGPGAGAQDAAPPVEEEVVPATVTIGSRLVAVMRTSIYGHTPQTRAANAEERIRAALRENDTADFKTVVRSEGTMIYFGAHHLLTVLHGDLDVLAGETMEDAVDTTLSALKAGFDQHRRGRDPRILARGAAIGAATTLLYAALAAGLFASSMRIGDFLRLRWADKKGLRVFLLEASIIARRLLTSVGFLALTVSWLSVVLQAFPQTETAGENVLGKVVDALSGLLTSVVASAPNLLIAMFIMAVAMAGVRGLNSLLRAVLSGRVRIPGIGVEVARPTATLAKVLVVLSGLIAAYPYLPGTSSDAFKGVSVMAGVIVSFGSAALFGQVSAGFVLMYSGAFRRGDWIVVGDGTEGRLREIGYLTTRVQTFREDVFIPNLVLLSQSVRNLSRASVPDAAPLMARVSIGYDAPWRQVYRLLKDAAWRTQGILGDPPPVVHQVDLGDFYVVYELTVYIDRAAARRIARSALYENIQDAFNEAGVQIMSPHYEGDPGRKVLAPRDASDAEERSGEVDRVRGE